MNHAEFLDVVVAEAEALAAAARAVGPDAMVPATPEWTMSKLVKHAGTTHRWAMAVVASGQFASPADLDLGLPASDAEYPDWIERGAAQFREVVGATDATADCWSWGPDQHAGFWSRRMAHETSMHRWDAETAVGEPRPIDPALAVDGIDERLVNLAASLGHSPTPVEILQGAGETAHLHATDAEGEWLLRFGPEGMEITREHAKGDVAVRGAANDLLLYLVGRRGLDGLEVFGDIDVLESRNAIRNF